MTLLGRRIEPDDQRRVLPRHRAGPVLCPRHELAGNAHRRIEGAAVESGEERLGDVGCRADDGRRRGHFDQTGAPPTDRVDHAGERRARQRPGIDTRVESKDAARHVAGHPGETARVDEGRDPAHRIGGTGAPGGAAAPRALS